VEAPAELPVPAPAPPAPALPPPAFASAPAAPPAQPALPVPPSPPAPPPLGYEDSRQESSGTFSWSNNGEHLEVKYHGTFALSDDDTDIVRMSPGSSVRVSDGKWLRGRSVEFSADSSGKISRRYYVGGSERPFEPEGREWLKQMMPRFVRMSGFNAKERAARILRNGGPSAVLAEISQIQGDYAKKVYFVELLRIARLDAATAQRLLEQAGREVDSDYELASILTEATALLTDDATRKAYFAAARSIDSDYEMRRTFKAAVGGGRISAPVLADLLDAVRMIDSDYEAATLLAEIANGQAIDGPARAPFFAAVQTIGSDYERGRVLKTVLKSELGPEMLAGVLSAAAAMHGYEASQVLQTAARTQDISGPARDAYMKAADNLSGYEQTQALAALAKNQSKR
jgi:hypothetical protein